MVSEPVRSPRLDGLRGVAILLVVFSHQGLRLPTDGPLGALYLAAVRMGWCGVDLFFVLSGFLITRILLRTREAPDFFRVFYARRTLRIFPIYYLWLAFMLLVVPSLGFLARFDFASGGVGFSDLWYWLYASNIGFALVGAVPHTILGLTWSLAIEEQFYLLWPLAVRRLRDSRLLAVCVACLLLAPLLRAGWLLGGGAPIGAFLLTPCRLDVLAVGAAIAIVARRANGVADLQAWGPRLLGIGALSTIALVAWRSARVGPAKDALVYDPFVQVAGYSLLALCFGGAVVLAAFPRSAGGWLELRPLRAFGRYSYAMYLTHTFVSGLVVVYVWAPLDASGAWAMAATYAVEWALMLAVAMASWWTVERHFDRLKRRFAYRMHTGGRDGAEPRAGGSGSDDALRRAGGRPAIPDC